MKQTMFKSNSFNISKPLLDKNYHICYDNRYISEHQTLRLTR